MKAIKRIIIFLFLLSGFVFLGFKDKYVEASPILGTNAYSSITGSMYQPFRAYDFGQMHLGYSETSREITIQNSNGIHPSYTSIRSGLIQSVTSYGGVHATQGSALVLLPGQTSKSARFSIIINDLNKLSKIEFSLSTFGLSNQNNIANSANASLRLYYFDMEINDYVVVSGNLISKVKHNVYNKVSINVNHHGLYELRYEVPSAISSLDYRIIVDDFNLFIINPVELNRHLLNQRTLNDDILYEYFGKNRSLSNMHLSKIYSYSNIHGNIYDFKIINVIPKEFFFSEGTFGYVGKEWGFATDTTKNGNYYHTNLIIFDITKINPGFSVKADDLENLPLEKNQVKTVQQTFTQVTIVLNTTFVSYEDVYDYKIKTQTVSGGGTSRFGNYALQVSYDQVLNNHNNPLIGTTDATKAYIQRVNDITASAEIGYTYNQVLTDIQNVVSVTNLGLNYADTAAGAANAIGLIQEIPVIGLGIKILSAAETIAAFAREVTKEEYRYMTYILGAATMQSYERLTSWNYASTAHYLNSAGDYHRQVLTLSHTLNETSLLTKIVLNFSINGKSFTLVNDDRTYGVDTFSVYEKSISPYSNSIKTSSELKDTHYTFKPTVSGYYTFVGHENASLTIKNQSFKQLFYDNGIRQGYEFDDVGDMIFVDVYVKPQTTLYLIAGQTYYISMKNRSTYSSFIQFNPNKLQVIIPTSGGSGGGGGGGGGGGPILEFQ